MAYMNAAKKALLAPAIKATLKKYGIKGSIAVRDHASLVVNIKSGAIDLINNFRETVSKNPRYEGNTYSDQYLSVNPYHYKSAFTGKSLSFIDELITAMNDGNHDRSEIQTDYFDIGWFVEVNIGQWDKPYLVV